MKRVTMMVMSNRVSVLYREPKLLKYRSDAPHMPTRCVVSVLYREPKLLKLLMLLRRSNGSLGVSVLYREPKLLK